MTYSRIAGTGRYLPEKILTNADLEKMVETSDEWIRGRTGIRERRVVAEGEALVDLVARAGRAAGPAAPGRPQFLLFPISHTCWPHIHFCPGP